MDKNKDMSYRSENHLEELIKMITRKAPEYIDLLSAQTEDDFETALDAILQRAIDDLEANKKKFMNLDEEGLSGALAMGLNMPGLTVTQETNSNGHVDITIKADHCQPMRKTLCEAKIYRGSSHHIKGLTQLIDRYTTGREKRSLLIVYFKKQNIKGLTEQLSDEMDKQLPCEQVGSTTKHSFLKWSFISTHIHNTGEKLKVCHIGCNLYTESTTPSTSSAG